MDNLSDIYKEVSKYDVHYSTVRTTVTTFLVSVSYSLGLLLWKENLKEAALIFPVILLIFAILLSTYFQRLTNSCRKIQVELENGIASPQKSKTLPTTPPHKFRQRLEEEFHKTKVFHWDLPNIALVVLTVLYFIGVIHIAYGIHIVVGRVEDTAGTSTHISGLEVRGNSGKVVLTWQENVETKGFILHRSEKDNYTPITCLIPYFECEDKNILLYRFTDNSTKAGGKYDCCMEIIEPDHKGGLKIWKLGE